MFLFIKRLWHGETAGLTAAAVIVGAASLASRAVGVVRDRVLVSTFGAGDVLDAYYAAFRLPDLLYTLIILGALSAGFVPVFAEYLETRGRDEAWRLAERVLSVVGATMIIVSGALALFASELVPRTVPGFSPEKLADTIRLTRIMALSPVILGLSAVLGGVLQATRRFLAFSLAPVLYNVGIIFGALVLAPAMGIEGLAWGVVLGAFLHLITQASVAIRLGLGRIPMPSLHTEGVRRILWLMAPRTAGLAVTQINLVVLQALASLLPAGSIAVFNLANNLQAFPVGIFAVSFAVAAFPNMARAAGAKRNEEFREVLSSAARKSIFLILPAMAVFFLLRTEIVQLILGTGAFAGGDVQRTADVLGIFSFSLVFQGLVPLLARAFYAIQDTWTPLIAGVVSEACNLGFAIMLREEYGIMGLAAAFGLAMAVNFLLLWGLLRYRGHSLGSVDLTRSVFKTILASAALFVLGYFVRQGIGLLIPSDDFWSVSLKTLVTLCGGMGAFAGVALLLRSQELEEFKAAALRRFMKRGDILPGAEDAQ